MDRQQSLDVRRLRRAAMTGQRERLVVNVPELPTGTRTYSTPSDDETGALALRARQLELAKLRS
jgi:hypothetical protein